MIETKSLIIIIVGCLLAGLVWGYIVGDFLGARRVRNEFCRKIGVKTARLANGRIVRYDVCSDKSDAYGDGNYQLIGDGIIHTISGVKQGGIKKRYFYTRKY